MRKGFVCVGVGGGGPGLSKGFGGGYRNDSSVSLRCFIFHRKKGRQRESSKEQKIMSLSLKTTNI